MKKNQKKGQKNKQTNKQTNMPIVVKKIITLKVFFLLPINY